VTGACSDHWWLGDITPKQGALGFIAVNLPRGSEVSSPGADEHPHRAEPSRGGRRPLRGRITLLG
jgi:hypothetical protein